MIAIHLRTAFISAQRPWGFVDKALPLKEFWFDSVVNNSIRPFTSPLYSRHWTQINKGNNTVDPRLFDPFKKTCAPPWLDAATHAMDLESEKSLFLAISKHAWIPIIITLINRGAKLTSQKTNILHVIAKSSHPHAQDICNLLKDKNLDTSFILTRAHMHVRTRTHQTYMGAFTPLEAAILSGSAKTFKALLSLGFIIPSDELNSTLEFAYDYLWQVQGEKLSPAYIKAINRNIEHIIALLKKYPHVL